ncbi:MAG: hypothetical protein EOS41_31300, partial [Mesorhizobium sp.]|uniref:hypothetical protein n=1 Tax=Mesorhizobium sp. TaxID=1871066 RepID=UPI000FE8A7AA
SLRFHPANAAHANAHSASMLSLDDSYIRYFIIETRFRPYGVCRRIHTVIDCLRALQTRHRLDHADVRGIHVETVSEFVRDFDGPWPQSTIEVAFHIPYALALELHSKSCATGPREDDLIDEAQTAERISLSTLTGADDKFYAEKLATGPRQRHLQNGETVSAEAEIPTDTPCGGPPLGRRRSKRSSSRSPAPRRPNQRGASEICPQRLYPSVAR